MMISARLLLCLCMTLFAAVSVHAQSGSTLAPIIPTPSSTRASTRTVTANITAVNAPARSISLHVVSENRLQVPAEIVVALQEGSCRPFKNGQPATLGDFVAGEKVVARLTWRTTPERVVILRDLYDEVSYAERQRQGKEICLGVVDAFTATELSVQRKDGKRIVFRVTDKTRLVKNDAAAMLNAFPVGSPVAVKPRRLPSGDLQAAIIGGTAIEVNWAYRDTLTIWSGSVLRVQGNEQSGAVIFLHREDGAKRQFLLPVGAKFKQGRSELPWRMLPGVTISAHLVKTAEKNGMRYADAVKMTSRRTRVTPEDTLEEP